MHQSSVSHLASVSLLHKSHGLLHTLHCFEYPMPCCIRLACGDSLNFDPVQGWVLFCRWVLFWQTDLCQNDLYSLLFYRQKAAPAVSYNDAVDCYRLDIPWLVCTYQAMASSKELFIFKSVDFSMTYSCVYVSVLCKSEIPHSSSFEVLYLICNALCMRLASFPGLRPDFISQLRRKITAAR